MSQAVETKSNRGCLAITRKTGQSIEIEDVTVEVVEIAKNKVKLCIRADRAVRIMRTEVVGRGE